MPKCGYCEANVSPSADFCPQCGDQLLELRKASAAIKRQNAISGLIKTITFIVIAVALTGFAYFFHSIAGTGGTIGFIVVFCPLIWAVWTSLKK